MGGKGSELCQKQKIKELLIFCRGTIRLRICLLPFQNTILNFKLFSLLAGVVYLECFFFFPPETAKLNLLDIVL